ncbi:MAG: ABC transporter ATP-binding protein [Candidatus Saccharibacteria bacterium]|nr:ABC transporter ATP-binding protein [Candidatus Saccharibacteria bacterium]
MSVIEIKNVSVRIGDNAVLDNVQVDVAKGRITGLLGPSGAGKTTLYKAILGLRKITSGDIVVLGKDSSDKSLHENVGYMTQSPSVYYDLTVNENLKYFSQVSGASKGQVAELVDVVDLSHRQNTLIKNLSGGEKLVFR